MGLICNGTAISRQPLRFIGGTLGGELWGRSERHNRSVGGLQGVFSAYPSGSLAPKTHIMPRKSGAMATRFKIEGSGSYSASGAMGVNGEMSIACAGELLATLQLVASAVVDMTGSAVFAAGLAGKIEAVVAMAGTGNVDAAIGALAGIFANMQGAASVSASPRALGLMRVDVTPFTELSPQSLAQAVWATVIEAGLNAEEAMRLIAAATAGKVSGGASPTVTIRNVGDTKNRIVASVDNDGNRTAVTYDLSD
jgi:hypothetical protein